MHNEGLGSWLIRRLEKSGPKVAVIHGDDALTYRQLHERSARLAGALASAGVRPRDRVALLGENSPAFLETLFAVGMVGAVLVPLNTRLAVPEIRYQLEDSGAKLLIHDETLTGLAEPASRELPDLLRWAVGGSTSGGTPALDSVIAAADPWTEDVPVSLDDLAVILYTSGTTGRPKGACLTHGNFTWNCFNVLVDYDLSVDEVSLMISPMFHVASLGMGVLPALLKGATLVLESKFDPARVLRLIEKHRVTWLSGVPTTFQMLCEHPDWETRDISSLRQLTCGGSAVPMRVLEAYENRGLAFTANYGMTETSPGATTLPAARSRDKAGSSGLPHFFTDVRVVDAGGHRAQPGATGEILISGPNVIAQYWNRPDAAGSFEGQWFHSGDLGYLDEDGYLFVADRIKDMIISGGENIYPAEIEAVIQELPEVAAVAVVGVVDEKWGEVPHAVVVPRDGAQLTAEKVQEHLAGRLARYKVPKTLSLVPDMPRTASGKIRKNVLREQATR
ncbi:o-succinylbenzoate--CoA ligase [Kocuria sp. SM24M-10]|uniref:o-succinylbenzoate--CoA ligase n=1 Tax=Kocuria sp. SM24M-10 TaxID=1660349 RepID=UPI000649E8BF|nr:o-succinylbenzoate--CoA ligase [Kocuria sp. SM24M-10]KLU08341.1 AMP-dependent synthetase [Kocuria sp. SM24M-10]